MPTVSREIAFEKVYQQTLGSDMLGIFERLSSEIDISRIDGDDNVILMGGLRGAREDSLKRVVTLFSVGTSTNVRVTDLSRVSPRDTEVELGLEASAAFSFEVGAFDSHLRRTLGDLHDAPFNGRVKRLDSGLYEASSVESNAYQASFRTFEDAFVRQFGATNKLRIVE